MLDRAGVLPASLLLQLVLLKARRSAAPARGEQMGLFGLAPPRPAAPVVEAAPPAPAPAPSPQPSAPPAAAPPAPTPGGARSVEADLAARQAAYARAREVLADRKAPHADLQSAHDALPRTGDKAARLREQLQARIKQAAPPAPAPAPSPAPAPQPAPATKREAPTGDDKGWDLLPGPPGSAQGGQRRRRPDGNMEYRWPSAERATAAHAALSDVAARSEQVATAAKQRADNLRIAGKHEKAVGVLRGVATEREIASQYRTFAEAARRFAAGDGQPVQAVDPGVRPAPASVPHPPPGYTPIARSTRGGHHKREADGSYSYWYPDTGITQHAHEDDHPRVRAAAALGGLGKVRQAEDHGLEVVEGHDRGDEIGHGWAAQHAPGHKLEAHGVGLRAKVTPAPAVEPPAPAPTPEPAVEAPPPAPPAPAPAPARRRVGDGSGRTTHLDVGDKIGGARKDMWAAVNGRNLAALEAEGSSEAYKRTTRDAVWGEMTAEQLREAGDTAGAAALKLALMRGISVRPWVPDESSRGMTAHVWGDILRKYVGPQADPSDHPKVRELFVSAIEKLRRDLDACHTVQEVEALVDDLRDVFVHGGAYESEERVTPELLERLRVEHAPRGGNTVFAYVPGGDRQGTPLDGATLQAAGLRLIHREGGSVLRRMHPDVTTRIRPQLQSIVLGKRWVDGVLSQRGAVWDARMEARRRKDDDWGGLVANPYAADEQKEGKAERQQRYVLTRSHEVPVRTGGRQLAPGATGADLLATFGLRAVEYGNWVNDADAQKHVDHLHGALHDLAELVGLEPRQLAHGGKLAVAFGARGGGRAGAHYEPARTTINLTHTRGGGTFAHEWGHYLDHMLAGGGAGRRIHAVSEGDHRLAHPEVRAAAEQVMRAINEGSGQSERHNKARAEVKQRLSDLAAKVPEMNARLRELQALPASEDRTRRLAIHNDRVAEHLKERDALRGSLRRLETTSKMSKFAADADALGEYWSRPHEMFARAFEAWAEDKLHEQGRRSDYLVTGTRDARNVRRYVGEALVDDVEPYPQGEERARINRAIEHLVATVRRTGALVKAQRRVILRDALRCLIKASSQGSSFAPMGGEAVSTELARRSDLPPWAYKVHMLRDSILLLKAKARAAVGQQVGLFGAPSPSPAAAPAPRPAPPPTAPETRGTDIVNVRTHLRTTSHGVEIVHAHQAHVVHGQVEESNHPQQQDPTPRDADPQQTVEAFRLAVGRLQKTYRHLFENAHADMGAIREASAAFKKAAGPLLALHLPRFHRADEAKRLEKLTTAIQAIRQLHDAPATDSAASRADSEVMARLQFDRLWRLSNSVRQQAGHVADLLSRPIEIKHGPFVLVNRHGFRAEEIQPSVELLDKAASIVAAVGFGGVNRGRVLLVGKLKDGDVVHNTFAGRYSNDKDTVELNVESKYRVDAVHTIVHELGHRAWYKLMTEAERNEWIEHYENSGQRPVRVADRERLWGFWRDSGYDLRRAVRLAGPDGDLLRDYLKNHGSNTVPAPERHITEDMVRRWFVRPDKGAWFGSQDGARSVSAYGATDPKEDFAEVFADWAQRRAEWRNDYPPHLMGRIRLLERIQDRLATKTAHE